MDYGRQALRHLCLIGGETTLDAVCKEISISPERIGPVMAGLEHNGYITRKNSAGSITVSLTSRGRDWARQFGVPLYDGPVRPQPPAAEAGVARPAPSAPSAPSASELVKAGMMRRSTARTAEAPAAKVEAAEKTSPEPVAEPAAAPQATAGSVAAEPAQEAPPAPMAKPRGRRAAAKAEAAELPLPAPTAEGEQPAEAAAPKRRGRPPKAKAAAVVDPVKEVEVDDTGFVTHINGRRLF